MHAKWALFWLEIGAGLLLLFCLHIGIKLFVRWFSTRSAQKNTKDLAHHIPYILKPPLMLFLWTWGVTYIVQVLATHIPFSLALSYLLLARKALSVIAISWFFLRWIKEAEKFLLISNFKRLDSTMIRMLRRLTTITIFFVTVLILMKLFGLDTAPFLAVGTIGGAALGFGGKDIVSNWGAGFMLYLTRPFILGDYIYLPEKNLEGMVEEIGWSGCLIRDKEKQEAYLPNSFFTTSLVINLSRIKYRRFAHTLTLPLESSAKLPLLMQSLEHILQSSALLDRKMPVKIYCSKMQIASFQLQVEAYLAPVELEVFQSEQTELLLKIAKLLKEERVECTHIQMLGSFS